MSIYLTTRYCCKNMPIVRCNSCKRLFVYSRHGQKYCLCCDKKEEVLKLPILSLNLTRSDILKDLKQFGIKYVRIARPKNDFDV